MLNWKNQEKMIPLFNGISNLRNVMGDAHAKSKKKYYKPTERHALLAVNISKVISDFLYGFIKGRFISNGNLDVTGNSNSLEVL